MGWILSMGSPLHYLWVLAHISGSWSVVSALAAKTNTIKLGTNVPPVTRRRPQVLAKQLVTIDQISGGRVILGAGLGGDGQGKEAGEEFTRFGEPSKYRVLARKADEAFNVILGLWSGNSFKYAGKFRVQDVQFLPKPLQEPRILICIGEIKNPALRRAARYDGWIRGGPCPSVGEPGLSFEEVSEKMKLIEKHREHDDPFDLVYDLEFPETGMSGFVSESQGARVSWMLDIVSALRFKTGEAALEYIRQGPLD
ncbi:LLM class flavin-dependent oxidoreductase [Candidatus Bathyarchaeota archaeon]|nr:LLM class flavin-dependent oxidoreductase [Candidatus Bathyarchaeota archaeon]